MAQTVSRGNPIGQVRGVYYGWWLSGLAGLIMVVSAVPVFHGMAVWAVVLEHHFGWSRLQLGIALSLTRAEGALFGPLEGYLADRLGTRVMVMAGLLVLCGAFVLFSQTGNFRVGLYVDALLIFYLAFMLMSLGQGLGGWVPLMTMLNHWFSRYRGTSMGISMAVMTSGALLVVPALAWAIDPEQQRIGWRTTALIIAGVILAGALLFPLFLRNRPQDMGLLPDGDRDGGGAPGQPQATDTQTAKGEEQELTLRQALRTQAFWCIAFGHGFASMIILAIMTHLGLMMTELGYSLQTVAWIVSVYSFVSLPFQLGGGYLGDRIPTNVALFLFTAIQGAAVVLITISSSIYMFYLFAVLFGIGFGGRTPLTTAIRGEYFGRASFGKILGISTVPMNILLLVASPLAGFMRDQLGDYQWAFLSLAILNGIGAFFFLIARKPKLPSAAPAAVSSQPVLGK